MPSHTSYSLSLSLTTATLRLPARVGAALITAAAAISILTFTSRPAAPSTLGDLPAAERAVQPAAVEPAGAVVAETSSAQADTAPAPVLVSETSSVQSQERAASDASSQPALTAQAGPSGAVQSAPPAAAAAPVAPPAVPARPGARWTAEGFVFVLDGQAWDATSFTNVEGALERLPARIRGQLGNRALGDVNILVNRDGRALSGKQPYSGAANFYSTNDGHNELVLFPDQSVLTILHEMGHAYNLRRAAAGRYALVLLDPEMQSFMAATGWRVLSTPEQVRAARDQLQVQFAYDGPSIWPRLSNNDPLEDFANSFALYFFSPGELQQKSPERFAWFQTNVGH